MSTSDSLPSRYPTFEKARQQETRVTNDTPRQVGLRLFVCLSTILVGVLGLLIPGRMYPLVDETASLYLTNMLLTIGASMGIADVLLNDILGVRFSLRITSHWRELWYLILAMLYLSLIFMSAKVGVTGAHMLQYGINVLACVWVAVFDVKYRYIQPRGKSPHES